MVERQSIELKKRKVAELVELIEKSKTIALVNLENLPAKQLKAIRAKLAGKARFIFAKKTLLKRAFEAAKRQEAKALLPHLEEINPSLIFSELDAFSLFKELKAGRQMVAAKPGQTAPFDIIVPAGPTPFTPGPAISELAQLGLKTKVEGGKIYIREDTCVVKAGDEISTLAAGLLSKLGITPMQVGVKVTHVLEGNELYEADILDVSVEKYAQDLKIAILNAFTLAIELGIATKETIEQLVQKAYRLTKAVADKIQNKAQ
ncbi:MAG: 50S ribosomal protein L10 [Candidatus Nanoarchaeia archaeon]